MSNITFTLFGRKHEATTLAEASAAFSAARDASGRGSSTMPLPEILQGGVVIGYFSYNGKIWDHPSSAWQPGDEPVFNPYAEA